MSRINQRNAIVVPKYKYICEIRCKYFMADEDYLRCISFQKTLRDRRTYNTMEQQLSSFNCGKASWCAYEGRSSSRACFELNCDIPLAMGI